MIRTCQSIYLSCLLVALVSTSASAACSSVANIEATEGIVSIKPAGQVVKRSPGKLPAPLCVGDEVHTFAGKALIKSGGDTITLDRDSILSIQNGDRASVGAGQALFDIRKRSSGQSLRVATRLSVIGVKGTRFLVADRSEGVSVALDQGVVEVKSTQGPLGLYRERVVEDKPAQDFDAFRRAIEEGLAREQQAFESYKQQVMREFVAYVESVTMQAGSELTFSDGTALERQTSDELKAAVASLSDWTGRQ